MKNYEIKILKNEENGMYYEQMLEMLRMADDEFFPPLSARNCTTQSDFSHAQKGDNGVLSYFDGLKNQKFAVAYSDDELLGFVSFKENFTNKEIGETELPNIYITTLIVSPGARGMGITGAMYEKLFDNYAYVNVFTRTWSTNIAHIKILSKFKFDTFKVLKDDRAPGVDTVYFKRIIQNC